MQMGQNGLFVLVSHIAMILHSSKFPWIFSLEESSFDLPLEDFPRLKPVDEGGPDLGLLLVPFLLVPRDEEVFGPELRTPCRVIWDKIFSPNSYLIWVVFELLLVVLLALLVRLTLFRAEKLEREAFAFLVSNMGFAIELKLLLTPKTKFVRLCRVLTTSQRYKHCA